MEGVNCWCDGMTWYSKESPGRAAMATIFGGYALYLRTGDETETPRLGIADEDNTYRFLKGEPMETIKYLTVLEPEGK